MSEGRTLAADEGGAAFSPSGGGAPRPGPEAADEGGARLGSEIEAVIGRRLKAIYDDVVKEEVPDRFLQLLAELERSTAPPASAGAAPRGADATEDDR